MHLLELDILWLLSHVSERPLNCVQVMGSHRSQGSSSGQVHVKFVLKINRPKSKSTEFFADLQIYEGVVSGFGEGDSCQNEMKMMHSFLVLLVEVKEYLCAANFLPPAPWTSLVQVHREDLGPLYFHC